MKSFIIYWLRLQPWSKSPASPSSLTLSPPTGLTRLCPTGSSAAAALLNACLDSVTKVTDELKKLMAEFEKVLAILKGRVGALEAKVCELEANQFSASNKLNGIATMNYDVRRIFDTSFTGKDLLRTTLRCGNFANSALGNRNTALEMVFPEDQTGSPGV